MKVIEKYIEGKYNEEKCEDGIVINDNFIAIVDGATAQGNILWNGKTSGRFAMEIICNEIQQMNEEIDAYSAIEQLNNAIKNAYGNNYNIAKEKYEERIIANVIIFSKYRNEIWIFGDCQCLINGSLIYNSKKTDIIFSEIRSLYINLELLNGMTKEEIMKKDIGREYILPLLKQSMKYANSGDSEYGYNTIDGFEIDSRKCIIKKVNLNDEIVLASDGYPYLKSTLKESEEELSRIIKNDPLCINLFKSTKGLASGNKTFDDRTYVRFIV